MARAVFNRITIHINYWGENEEKSLHIEIRQWCKVKTSATVSSTSFSCLSLENTWDSTYTETTDLVYSLYIAQSLQSTCQAQVVVIPIL